MIKIGNYSILSRKENRTLERVYPLAEIMWNKERRIKN